MPSSSHEPGLWVLFLRLVRLQWSALFFGVCSLREAVKEERAGEKDSGKNFRGFFLCLTLQGDEGCSVVHPEKERVLIVGLQVQAGGRSDFDNNSN